MTKKRKNSSTVDAKNVRSETGKMSKKDAERILDLITNAKYSTYLYDSVSLRTAEEFFPETIAGGAVHSELLDFKKYLEIYCSFLESEVRYLEIQSNELYTLYKAMGKIYEG